MAQLESTDQSTGYARQPPLTVQYHEMPRPALSLLQSCINAAGERVIFVALPSVWLASPAPLCRL